MPQKKPSKPREPERDYSHRTLAEKLGIKPGQRIAVLGVEDSEFQRDLELLVPHYSEAIALAMRTCSFFPRKRKKTFQN